MGVATSAGWLKKLEAQEKSSFPLKKFFLHRGSIGMLFIVSSGIMGSIFADMCRVGDF